MLHRLTILFVVFAINSLGCVKYIRDLPAFPEVQILGFSMPMHGVVNEQMTWKAYANTCTDCLRVTTYDNRDLLRNYPLLVQSGKFKHGSNPSSELINDWLAVVPGRYVLYVEAWNRWTNDTFTHFVDIEVKDVYQGWD